MTLTKQTALFVASAWLAAASPAHASAYLFSTGTNSAWTLTINGTDYLSVDEGWITDLGRHQGANDNYIAAADFIGRRYNNWGVFDLSNLTGPVSSAVLTLNTFGVQGVPLTYTLFDTNATLAELDADRGDNNAGGIALFQDLGSGTSYGNRVYTSADANALRSITLTSDGLSAIAAAAGRQFALGGSVSTPPPAIPEPTTWAMMLVGFGAMGVALRCRQKVSVRFA